MKKNIYLIAGYGSYTFRRIKIAFKIIKAGYYSDFQMTASASIYPPDV